MDDGEFAVMTHKLSQLQLLVFVSLACFSRFISNVFFLDLWLFGTKFRRLDVPAVAEIIALNCLSLLIVHLRSVRSIYVANSTTVAVFTRYRTAGVGKQVRRTRFYHSRQCSIVLTSCSLKCTTIIASRRQLRC